MLKRRTAAASLIILTGVGPTLFEAASKNWTLIVQHNTVQNAITIPDSSICPVWCSEKAQEDVDLSTLDFGRRSKRSGGMYITLFRWKILKIQEIFLMKGDYN